MTDRPTGMLGDVLGFLKNHLKDVNYQHSEDGTDFCNHCACTLYFETDDEAKLYISQLETTIKMLKDNK